MGQKYTYNNMLESAQKMQEQYSITNIKTGTLASEGIETKKWQEAGQQPPRTPAAPHALLRRAKKSFNFKKIKTESE